jgi:hypothetical protein
MRTFFTIPSFLSGLFTLFYYTRRDKYSVSETAFGRFVIANEVSAPSDPPREESNLVADSEIAAADEASLAMTKSRKI